MNVAKINLAEKLTKIQKHWSPRIAAELNGQQVKLAKVKGEFVWHHHDEADELFFVVKGKLAIHFRDRVVDLSEGEMLVVPRGVEHKPVAEEEAHILLLEPAHTRNTGNVTGEMTIEDPGWI